MIDEFIVMPHHLHGIIYLKDTSVETTRRVVSTTLKPNSLGSIIGQIKSKTTKLIHELGYYNFAWQTRFYDHIIKNEEELIRIREYIINNPLKWEMDEYYRKE